MPYFGINQRFSLPPKPKSVRRAPELVCGLLRNHCATYPGFTVRHEADFASAWFDVRILAEELII